MGCAASAAKEEKEEELSGSEISYTVSVVKNDDEILRHEVDADCETAMKIVYRKKQRWRLAMWFFKGRQRFAEEENNSKDTWLLVDNNGDGEDNGDADNVDACSVNSSFRFSFGSQLELEACGNGATVLLVNLDKGAGNGNDDTVRVQSEFEWARLQSLERQIIPAVEGLARFQYEEIRRATADFSQDRVLGRGAHSCVYRGRLRLGRLIAVKLLDKNDKESGKDFCRELHIASSLKNRHVVPLLGFCIDPQGLFLVYKFISGGSLEYHLHEKKGKGKGSLSWSDRLRVAIGIAKAVDYLHHGTHKCVVHRDIKPSNILLSSRKTAKLCDFGLATWTLGASMPFLCKTVKGTFGYLAPEYFQHGKVSDKTDIYAFGVVLLELLTGRKPIETKRHSGNENLVIWARPLLYGGMAEELVDPQLRSSYKSKQVDRMMRAAAVCLHPTESWRPCMSKVLGILRGQEDSNLLHHTRLSMLNVNADFFVPNETENIKALDGHLALAMLGVELDAEEEKNNYKDR